MKFLNLKNSGLVPFITALALSILVLLLAACGSEPAGPTASPAAAYSPAAATTVPASISIAGTATPVPATVPATLAPAVTGVPASPTPPAALATPAAAVTPGAPAVAPPALADFSAERAFNHVKELAGTIGSRAAGSPASRRAADYIANYYKSLGLTTERLSYRNVTTRDSGSAVTFSDTNGQGVTLRGAAVRFSGSGRLTAPLVYSGLAQAGQIPPGSLKGKIALIQRGEITFQEKVASAVAAGAAGVIIYNNQEGPLDNVTLENQASIPVIGINRQDGQRLRDELQANKNLSVELNAGVTSQVSELANVAATRPASAPNLVPGSAPILIFGGHFDSVPAGPGANDNAGGTAIVMELARVLLDRYPQYELRFLAFDGEEIGLTGSKDYVQKMPESDRRRVTAMFNIDMVAVGNTLYLGGTPQLTGLALGAAAAEGAGDTQVMPESFLSYSDGYSFHAAGIPVLFLNRESDPDYHKPGDVPDKVKPERLAQIGHIVMKVIDGLVKS